MMQNVANKVEQNHSFETLISESIAAYLSRTFCLKLTLTFSIMQHILTHMEMKVTTSNIFSFFAHNPATRYHCDKSTLTRFYRM